MPSGGQAIGSADAGQLQKLRRIDGAGAQNHIDVGVGLRNDTADGILDALGAPAAQEHAVNQRSGLYLEIRAAESRCQIRAGSAAPPAVAGGAVDPAKALLPFTVRVGSGAVAGLQSGLNECGRQRCSRQIGSEYRQGPGPAVIRISAVQMTLCAFKVRQYVCIAPPRQSRLGPAVVVVGVAADVDHAVDGRRAAEHPPPRMREAPAVEVGLRIRHIVPVEAVGTQQAADCRRHRNSPAAVFRACLEQQYARFPIFREPRREHAAR